MARAYGFELYDPVRSARVAQVEKALMELSIVAHDQVPNSRRPFREDYQGRDFYDSESAAKYLLHLYPPVSGTTTSASTNVVVEWQLLIAFTE